MEVNEHPHIFLNNSKTELKFGLDPKPIIKFIPIRDRNDHAQFLRQSFDKIWEVTKTVKEERIAVSLPSKNGFYIEFRGKAGCDLATKSLENFKSNIRLLNIRQNKTDEGQETFDTIYIPNNQTDFFLKKIREYLDPTKESKDKKTPKNKVLLNSIEGVVIASQLASFWQDSTDLIPNELPVWCEAWLFYSEGSNKEELKKTFYKICKEVNIELKNEMLHFPERMVFLIKANKTQLKELIERCDNLAEFRRAQETAGYWTSQTNIEQLDWVKNLLKRLNIFETEIVISILDGGINNGHLLLQPILADSDCHSYHTDWGITDTQDDHHGTLMSGIAAYDNLQKILENSLPIDITHKLESIKILPPKHLDKNPYELWGEIVSQSISRAEIANPNYKRILCLAITSDKGTDLGRPSSWSASIDSLSSGAEDGLKRLFILSAGNTYSKEEWQSYPESNKKRPVQSPAQSWNALTVGAYTKKIQINEEKFKGYKALAKADCLSPFSATSYSWEENKWPIKPDVLMEGGNVAIAPDGFIGNHEDLSSLTVSANNTKEQFSTINATSESTAHAAWFAAQLQVQYPDAWPETIRGLIVHSAEWTPELISQFKIDLNKKGSIAKLMKICGYGVPNFRKALNSLNNSLTLIAQEEIQPFIKRDSGGYKVKDMHLFKLPWPKETLLGLGEKMVKLRITLSYFIEPGPGEIGWKDRYRYASHALRFDLNNPSESIESFTKRINAAIERDDDYQSVKNDTERWVIGSDSRHHGSIHSDYIERTAAEIASSSLIGIYPVVGWWRERTNLKFMEKRSRYSLIISLHTEAQEVDLYTPIINLIKTPVVINIR